jgi:hypothetical protein
LIARITTTGFTPPSPQPCRAWDGYGATNAHNVEGGVSADGHPSAPPSGATAVAPPASASLGTIHFIERLNVKRNAQDTKNG